MTQALTAEELCALRHRPLRWIKALREVPPLVRARVQFKASRMRMFSVWMPYVDANHGVLKFEEGMPLRFGYTVYSWGVHWPLMHYDAYSDVWIENATKYGTVSTTNHARHCPTIPGALRREIADMKEIINVGFLAHQKRIIVA